MFLKPILGTLTAISILRAFEAKPAMAGSVSEYFKGPVGIMAVGSWRQGLVPVVSTTVTHV